MLKLVDKPDLGSGAERRMGSIPFARTQKKLSYIAGLFSSAQVRYNGTDIPVIFCEDITTMSGRSIDNLVDVVRNSLNFA